MRNTAEDRARCIMAATLANRVEALTLVPFEEAKMTVGALITEVGWGPKRVFRTIIRHPQAARLIREAIAHYQHSSRPVANQLRKAIGRLPIALVKSAGLENTVYPMFGVNPTHEVVPPALLPFQ